MLPTHVNPLSRPAEQQETELWGEKGDNPREGRSDLSASTPMRQSPTHAADEQAYASLLAELAAAPITSGDGNRVLAHIGAIIARAANVETVLLLYSHVAATSWTVFPTRPDDHVVGRLIQNELDAGQFIDLQAALEWVKHTGQSTIYETLPEQSADFPQWAAAVLLPLPTRPGEVLCIGIADRHQLTKGLLQCLTQLTPVVAVVLHNLEEYRRAVAGAVVTERIRLSREIHDGIAQSIGYINLKLSALSSHLQPLGDQVSQRVVDIQQSTAQCLADLRHEMAALRHGLAPEIESASRSLSRETIHALLNDLTTMARPHGLTVTTDLSWPPEISDMLVDPRLTTQLTRIVQEAVINTIKHARATQVSVSVAITDGQLTAHVWDNGQGFDPATGEDTLDADHHIERIVHFGLAMMQERTRAIGGTLGITSQKGHGTCVEVQIPLNHSLHGE